MGAAAARHARAFGWDAAARTTAELYADSIDRTRAAQARGMAAATAR
jgi:D-inositol-3-phosphate glycosyltransferase